MTTSNTRTLLRIAGLAMALLASGMMTLDAYAHTVRWPQYGCRTSLSGHCKQPVRIATNVAVR